MKREILTDTHFENGFVLENPDASTHDRRADGELHFDRKEAKPNWIMAQWWTPFNFIKAPIKQNGKVFAIDNESRHYFLNTETGAFEMGLDSGLEYKTLYNDIRRKVSTPWSHFLFEQDFVKPALMSSLSSVRARVKFTIAECENNYKKEEFDPSLHAAQLLWYLTINAKNTAYSPDGRNFIWFGIPLFDSRVDHESFEAFIDAGNPGSTNRLIYNLDSRNYLKEKIEIGKSYSVDCELLPLMEKAIRYAKDNGIFKEDESLYLNYMNFGWELPGAYKVNAKIEGLSIEVTEK